MGYIKREDVDGCKKVSKETSDKIVSRVQNGNVPGGLDKYF